MGLELDLLYVTINETLCMLGIRQGIPHIPAFYMKLVIGNFNSKVGKENICKSTTRKYTLHNI